MSDAILALSAAFGSAVVTLIGAYVLQHQQLKHQVSSQSELLADARRERRLEEARAERRRHLEPVRAALEELQKLHLYLLWMEGANEISENLEATLPEELGAQLPSEPAARAEIFQRVGAHLSERFKTERSRSEITVSAGMAAMRLEDPEFARSLAALAFSLGRPGTDLTAAGAELSRMERRFTEYVAFISDAPAERG